MRSLREGVGGGGAMLPWTGLCLWKLAVASGLGRGVLGAQAGWVSGLPGPPAPGSASPGWGLLSLGPEPLVPSWATDGPSSTCALEEPGTLLGRESGRKEGGRRLCGDSVAIGESGRQGCFPF